MHIEESGDEKREKCTSSLKEKINRDPLDSKFMKKK